MASDLRRGRIRDDHDTWAVVEAGRVVVGVAVGRRADAMDGLNVGSTDDRAVAALGRLDWRRWAAHEHSWLVDFRLSEAPTAAGSSTSCRGTGKQRPDMDFNIVIRLAKKCTMLLMVSERF